MPQLTRPLSLLLGPAPTNTDPETGGLVLSSQSWKSGVAPMHITENGSETTYLVRSASPSRVEVAVTARMKPVREKSMPSKRFECEGLFTWDPKTRQLTGVRLKESVEQTLEYQGKSSSFSSSMDVVIDRSKTKTKYPQKKEPGKPAAK